jgi:Caenorhabditis protein of unknown function, DUF268
VQFCAAIRALARQLGQLYGREMATDARKLRTSVIRKARAAGLDVLAIRRHQISRRMYRNNRAELARQMGRNGSNAATFPFGRNLPCLADRWDDAGVASGQYFHQDLLVARWIHDARPTRHVDVASRVDGFVAHVASFRDIEVLDIRPVKTSAQGITFHQRDIIEADPAWDECCDSLSCLHALEHFGLGRYGDPVDVNGWKKGFDNLTRMVEPGGHFYFSVPIGPQRVEFDAHRVFSVPFLVDLVGRKFSIEQFWYIGDDDDLYGPADLSSREAANSFGCRLGCGILDLVRST